MNAVSLRDEVRARAEERPGVYRWLSPNGRILYVGKSVRLRSRLLSYFREDTGKTARLVAEAASVRWDYIPNEFAALFREMHLIRAWQPEYNVQHKRDRRYGFIKVHARTGAATHPGHAPPQRRRPLLRALRTDALAGPRGTRAVARHGSAGLFGRHAHPFWRSVRDVLGRAEPRVASAPKRGPVSRRAPAAAPPPSTTAG